MLSTKLACGYNTDLAKEHKIGAFVGDGKVLCILRISTVYLTLGEMFLACISF